MIQPFYSQMLTRRIKAYVHTNTCTNIHRCFICSSPALETTWMPIKWWVSKQWILFRDKKEWTLGTYNDMDKTQNSEADCKKPDPQSLHSVWCHLHTILENGNQSSVTDQGLPGARRDGRVTKEHQVTLGVMGNFITLTITMDPWVYIYVEPYRSRHFQCVQFNVCQLYLNKPVKKNLCLQDQS